MAGQVCCESHTRRSGSGVTKIDRWPREWQRNVFVREKFSQLAVMQPFSEHSLYDNHEKTYLAVAAFDNPRSDVCGCGNKGLVADRRNHN